MTPPIVVHPVDDSGGRPVTAHAEVLGRAHSADDVAALLRQAGLTDDEIDLRDPNLIEWRGGDADVWS
jgi:hypothetical protein